MGVHLYEDFKEFECKKCTANLQLERGCNLAAPFPVFVLDGANFFHCPIKIVDDETILLIRLYNHYKAGFLPVSGGILDQTSFFLKAMELISGEINDGVKQQ